MAEIKILIEGYAKKLKKGWVASSTACLITTEDKKIITDPGCNRGKLLEALKKENLTADDIDWVFLSHKHIDHSLNMGIFPKAAVCTLNHAYKNDKSVDLNPKILGNDIKIISTPGHASDHGSLLVKTGKGEVLIAGDLFWWADGEEQKIDYESLLNKADEYMKNREQLIDKPEETFSSGGLYNSRPWEDV